MYKINFETPIHVHFIGIGGISMSGLAEILLKEGFTISGSDNKESALTDHLEQMGAKVFYGQKASNIIPGIDVVVYTAAIHPDNEEYAEAVRQKLPMLTRAELLGQLMTNYDADRNLRYSRKDNHNFDAFTHSSRRRIGPYDLRRRNPESHRRKYPCGRL